MKKILIVLIILLTVGCGENESGKIAAKSISSSEVNRMITNHEDFILVDVRTKAEYESEHIKGAINIPLDEIESTTMLNKESKIVVYCQSGNRSAKAAQKLLDNGYIDVYDLGGIIGWTYETERE